MLLGDEPDVTDLGDLPLVVDRRHGDGVLAHLRGDVGLYFEAEVLQHEVA